MTISPQGFRTRLCDLLAIDYPVLQSGMGLIAGPDLVAEVSGAGALGIVAGFMLSAEQLRAAIRAVRERTTRPFGVNLWLSSDLRTAGTAAAPADDSIQAVQAALNPIRATLGLPAVTARPSPPPDLVPATLQVVLEERVPVLSAVMGSPDPDLVAECHRRDIKVIAMVTTVADAMTVEAAGVDAVIAQGAEAGGHRAHFEKPSSPERGAVGTLALVPQVVDALRVPVVAAGGIADGRGLVAATSEILRAISSSPTDLQPVLNTIAINAVRVGAERLFPSLRADIFGNITGAFGKWLGRWSRKIVPDRRKTAHSWRHVVATKLRQANVREDLMDELLGWTQTKMQARYGSGHTVQAKKDAIERIAY